MAMMETVGALMKGKLTPADKKKMEDAAKKRGEGAMKPGDLEKAVGGAASPFSYLLNMAKSKKAK